MRIMKLNEEAILPTKAYGKEAGWDVFSLENKTLFPGERHLFKIGWAISSPDDTYLRVASRSGNSLKKGLDVMGGVIDEIYTGEIGVIIVNLNQQIEYCHEVDQGKDGKHNGGWRISYDGIVEIKKGDKIAQLIPTKITHEELEIVSELKVTKRGNKGYGSSDEV